MDYKARFRFIRSLHDNPAQSGTRATSFVLPLLSKKLPDFARVNLPLSVVTKTKIQTFLREEKTSTIVAFLEKRRSDLPGNKKVTCTSLAGVMKGKFSLKGDQDWLSALYLGMMSEPCLERTLNEICGLDAPLRFVLDLDFEHDDGWLDVIGKGNADSPSLVDVVLQALFACGVQPLPSVCILSSCGLFLKVGSKGHGLDKLFLPVDCDLNLIGGLQSHVSYKSSFRFVFDLIVNTQEAEFLLNGVFSALRLAFGDRCYGKRWDEDGVLDRSMTCAREGRARLLFHDKKGRAVCKRHFACQDLTSAGERGCLCGKGVQNRPLLPFLFLDSAHAWTPLPEVEWERFCALSMRHVLDKQKNTTRIWSLKHDALYSLVGCLVTRASTAATSSQGPQKQNFPKFLHRVLFPEQVTEIVQQLLLALVPRQPEATKFNIETWEDDEQTSGQASGSHQFLSQACAQKMFGSSGSSEVMVRDLTRLPKALLDVLYGHARAVMGPEVVITEVQMYIFQTVPFFRAAFKRGALRCIHDPAGIEVHKTNAVYMLLNPHRVVFRDMAVSCSKHSKQVALVAGQQDTCFVPVWRLDSFQYKSKAELQKFIESEFCK